MIKMNGGKNDDVAVNVFAFGVRNAPLLKASWGKIQYCKYLAVLH